MTMLGTVNINEAEAGEESTEAEEKPEGAEASADADADDAPLSRRKYAEVERTVKEFAPRIEAAERQARESQAAIAARDAEIMRLRGATEALMAGHGRREAAAEPTPDELRTAGRKALADNDIETYEKNFSRAIMMEMRGEMDARDRARPAPAAAAPGLPPEVMGLIAHHRELVTKDNWEAHVRAADMALDAARVPDGPGRWARAFKDAEEKLGIGQTKQRPAFNRGNAALLSTDGAHEGGSGEAEEPISARTREIGRKAGLSDKEIRKFSKPGSELDGVKW